MQKLLVNRHGTQLRTRTITRLWSARVASNLPSSSEPVPAVSKSATLGRESVSPEGRRRALPGGPAASESVAAQGFLNFDSEF